MKQLKEVMVDTPKGLKRHAELCEDNDKIIFLHRNVTYEKDRMRIFDAYSIHPDVYERLKKYPDARYILFTETRGKKITPLKLLCEDLFKMKDGDILNEQGNKLVWEATFAGGKTIYIKIEAFNEVYKQYLTQPKLF